MHVAEIRSKQKAPPQQISSLASQDVDIDDESPLLQKTYDGKRNKGKK
jgi:hypothetical protein